MDTLTITIGRNVQGVPMPDDEWREFQADMDDTVKSVLNSENVPWVEGHYGKGYWSGEREESCKFMYALNVPLSTSEISTLKRRLAVIRGWYGQDAIAFNIGNSELI